MGQGGRRVEDQPGLAAFALDQLQGAVDVLGGLGVEGDVAGPGLGEIGDDPVDRLDHQVHVDGRGHAVLAQGLADQRTDRQVGYVVIVHHVEVHDVRAGAQHIVDLLAQACEIGGEDGRGDQIRKGHGEPRGRSQFCAPEEGGGRRSRKTLPEGPA
jgi:hypothetical protein